MKPQKNPILYIDDEKANLQNFKSVFIRDYNIFTAISAKEGLEILKKKTIYVVICDQRMPEISGIVFFEKIKEQYPAIIRIILTAFPEQEDILKAINKGGVYRYLTKPWKRQEMKVTIDNAIETYKLKEENKQLISHLQEKNAELSTINEQLKASEEKFRNIYNSTSDAIVITDTQGKILDANKTTINRANTSKKEILQKNLNDLPEGKSDELENHFKKLNDEKFQYLEFDFENHNKQLKSIELNSKKIIFEGKQAILHIIHDITEQKNIQKKILNTIIQTEEKERQRFAQDLHDGLGPVLSATKLYIQTIRDNPNNKNITEITNKSLRTIDEALKTSTEISNNLSPHVLQHFGTSAAIEAFIEKIQPANIHFQFSSNIKQRFDQDIEITLYRVTIELINNTLKHANAKNINIKLISEEDEILLNYQDDGKGFNLKEKMQAKSGMGIWNMQNRIKNLKGKVVIDSKKGKGTQIKISIPLQ